MRVGRKPSLGQSICILLAAIVLIIFFGIPGIKRHRFLKLLPGGRLVYVRGDSIVTYDFTTGVSKILLRKQNCSYPRWSPDGKAIFYKHMRDRNIYLNLVNSDGTGDKQICKIDRGSICHWIDSQTILIIVLEGTEGNKALDKSYIDIGTSANKFSSVINIDKIPKQMVWRPHYGGRWTTRFSISTKSDAVQSISELPEKTPTVITAHGSVACIKSIYPFFVPQWCGSNLRMVLATPSRKNYNDFLPYGKVIQNVYVVDKQIDALMFLPKNWQWIDPNDGGYPVWSPDGNMVAFDVYKSQYGQLIFICPKEAKSESDIYFMRERVSDIRVKGHYREGYSKPRWSPDSRFLVCTHTKPRFRFNIPLYSGEDWVFIYDFVSKRGIDFFRGKEPDWSQ